MVVVVVEGGRWDVLSCWYCRCCGRPLVPHCWQVLKEIEPVFNATIRGILFPEELTHHDTALVRLD